MTFMKIRDLTSDDLVPFFSYVYFVWRQEGPGKSAAHPLGQVTEISQILRHSDLYNTNPQSMEKR